MDLVEHIIKRYDYYYEKGKMPWVPDKIPIDVIKFSQFAKENFAKGKLLDIGCGNGWLSIFFAKNGFKVSGVDCCSAAIEMAKIAAKKSRVKVKFITENALKFPYLENSFDIVVDRGYFHHVPEKMWSEYKKGLNRILRAGGYYYLETFSEKTTRKNGKMPKGGRLWRRVKDESGYLKYDHFFNKELVTKLHDKNFELVYYAEDVKAKSNGSHLLHFVFKKK